MKTRHFFKRVILTLTIGLILSGSLFAQWDSYDGSWVDGRTFPSNQTFPWAHNRDYNAVLNWKPSSDPDVDYNRARTPIRDRFTNSDYWANSNARNDGGKFLVMGPWNPGDHDVNVSYGADYFDILTYSFWQYMDVAAIFNSWHNIVTPSMIEAAHRQGVAVYGLIMNPNASEQAIILQKNDNTFPMADKLVEIANYYGFDGWFFNFEDAGGSTNATLMRDFAAYFNKIGTPKGIKLQWYDSWVESGHVSYQNELNSRNDWYFHYNGQPGAHEMFLNYWTSTSKIANSKAHAESFGRSPYDVFQGFEVHQHFFQTNGDLRYPIWDVFPDGQPHRLSLAAFQMNSSRDHARTNETFYSNEEIFYSGWNHDPSSTNVSGQEWKGTAHYYAAKSVLNDVPWVTNFNTGHGHIYAINGNVLRNRDWYNRPLQDILPTWRWRVESPGTKLAPQFDWSDAYYGGNCLKVSGDLTSDNLIKLYMTSLDVSSSSKFTIAFKNGSAGVPTHMKVAISFEDSPSSWTYLDVGPTTAADWNIKDINLAFHAGRKIGAIGLFFDGGAGVSNYEMKIGRLGIIEGPVDIPSAPSNLIVDNKVEDKTDIASVRLKWTDSPSYPDIYYYNIYRRNPDNSLTYLSGTTLNAHFVAHVARVGSEATATIEIEAVSKEFGHSPHATATIKWDTAPNVPGPATKPIPSNSAADVPISQILSWTAGARAASHDVYFGTSNPPALKGNKSGTTYNPGTLALNTTYYWRIDEKNSLGTTTGTVWSFTTSSTNNVDHTDPPGTGTITARAEIHSGEGKEKAFDNLFSPGTQNSSWSKWLDNGGTPSASNPSWIQIQLPNAVVVDQLAIISANDGYGRDPEDFNLQASNDGTSWTTLGSWSGQTWNRFERKDFDFSNSAAYRYYRLNITRNDENVSMTQLCEIMLIGPRGGVGNRLASDDKASAASISKGELTKPSIYPNPGFKIISINGLKEKTNVQIRDINGKVLLETNTDKDIDVSSISTGTYFLKAGYSSPVRFIKK